MVSVTDRQLILSILDYLESRKGESGDSVSVDECLRLLQLAFDVDCNNADTRKELGIDTDLMTIFNNYVESHHLVRENVDNMANPDTNPELKAFIENLTTRGFFSGVTINSPEYQERYDRAIRKYLDRKGHTNPVPSPFTAEMASESEKLKQEGNDFFRKGRYAEAVESYGNAIGVSVNNPQNFISYCNRATAYFYLKEYDKAEADCLECIRLNVQHIKGYTRLVSVYSKLNRPADAIAICKKGLAIDPTNIELQSALSSLQTTAPAASTSAPADAAGLFSSLAQNPEIQEAARNIQSGNANIGDMLNNPALRDVASNIMSNPELMNNIMSSFGSLLGGQNGGGLSGLANLFGGMNGNNGNNDNNGEGNNGESGNGSESN